MSEDNTCIAEPNLEVLPHVYSYIQFEAGFLRLDALPIANADEQYSGTECFFLRHHLPMPKSLISRYQTNPKTKILILQREYTVPYSVPERTFCLEQVCHEQAVPQGLSDQSRNNSVKD